MRNALHEQLLKAGLINEERLEQAEREKRQARQDSNRPPAPRHGGKGRSRHDGQPQRRGEPPQRQGGSAPAARTDKPTGPVDTRAAASSQGVNARAAKASARAEAEAARRALEREVVALIKANRHQHNDGDEVFNFIDGRKIGRIYCTADTQRRLTRGELAIVRLRTRYAVVPTATAAGIAAKAPDLVLVAHQDAEQAVDPAYAEHPVPDDLRW